MYVNDSRSRSRGPVIFAVFVIAVIGLGLTYQQRSPFNLRGPVATARPAAGGDDDHPSPAHSHAPHEGRDDASAIELRAAAWKNVGLRTRVVMSQFTPLRSMEVPTWSANGGQDSNCLAVGESDRAAD